MKASDGKVNHSQWKNASERPFVPFEEWVLPSLSRLDQQLSFAAAPEGKVAAFEDPLKASRSRLYP